MKNWLFVVPWIILYVALFGAALSGDTERQAEPVAFEYRTPHEIGDVIGKLMLVRRYPEHNQEVWVDPNFINSAFLYDPQTSVALGRAQGEHWVLTLTATGQAAYHLKFPNSTSARALMKKIAEHGTGRTEQAGTP